MRRRRVTFYRHIKRMNEGTLTKRIFNYFERNPKPQMTWFKEVRKDMKEMEIDGDKRREEKNSEKRTEDSRVFKKRKKKKTGAKWTEERRKQHAGKMKEYWKRRKK